MSNPPVTAERTLVLPEARGTRSVALPGDPRSLPPADLALRDRLPWLLPTAIATVLLLGVLAFILSRPSGDPATAAAGDPVVEGPATPASTLDVPPPAPNAVLAIGSADSFTSTVLADHDEDLLAALAADPSSAAGLGGAAVTGDAVVVQQVFGADAFSVSSPDGGVPLLVYLPGATDELQGFVPGSTQVLFSGTLHPTPPDLGAFLGYEPASVAARTGAYVVAVPETVMQVDPPTV